MEYQSSLHKKLSEGEFVYTAETTPPDASNQKVLLTRIMPLKGIADAINITDGPGAKVHMSSLTAAIILSQNNDCDSCIAIVNGSETGNSINPAILPCSYIPCPDS